MILLLLAAALHPITLPPPPADLVAADTRKHAITHLITAASSGSPDAAWRLGQAYRAGAGIAQDPQQARRWLGQAGTPAARATIAEMDEQGEGAPANPQAAIAGYTAAAEAGNLAAARRLGSLYATGDLVPPDAEQARRWIEQAARAHDPEACYRAGLAASARADHAAAAAWFRDAIAPQLPADPASPQIPRQLDALQSHAALELGRQAELGLGQPADPARALAWYRHAAGGAFEALTWLRARDNHFNAGTLRELMSSGPHHSQPDEPTLDFLFKHGVPAPAAARAAAEALAASKKPDERVLATQLRRHGWGLPPEPAAEPALVDLQRDARQGAAPALYLLALRYQTGHGVPQDRAAAHRMLRHAALAGEARAALELFTWPPGEGEPDANPDARDLRWARRAAELGLDEGYDAVADAYEFHQDYAELARWYAAGLATGRERPVRGLAWLQATGTGIPAEPRAALALLGNRPIALRAQILEALGQLKPADEAYRQAAAHRDAAAMLHLGRRAEADGDARAARRWFEQAADAAPMGSPLEDEAAYHLGRCYEQGLGGPKDPAHAQEAYERSFSPAARRRLLAIAPALALDGLADWLRNAEIVPAYDLAALPPLLQPGGAELVATAAALLERAAAAGSADAPCLLGQLFEHGAGVPKSEAEARRWYQLASSRGAAEADYRLGLLAGDDHPAEAAAAFKRALGKAHARFERQELGVHLHPAHQQALRWLAWLHEEEREPPALFATAALDGPGARDDQPITWPLVHAAAQDPTFDGPALAELLAAGQAPPAATPAERAWTEARAAEGWVPARLILLAWAAADLPTARRHAATIQAAAEAGDVDAQGAWGTLLLKGAPGTPPDPAAAVAWRLVADAGGNTAATVNLDEQERTPAAIARAVEIWRRTRHLLINPE